MAEKLESTPFEEALEKTGNGLYNVLLVLTCGLILLAIGVDLFGFGLVVAAACDLNITRSQRGILTSLPYIVFTICTLILIAIGVDLFGCGLVVAAACDLNITVSQKVILTSLPYIGILLVSYIWGYISGTRGRRFSLLVSMQTAFVLSCLSSIATNWVLLGLIKFFSVCFSCAANSVTYTLLGESCIQRVRSKYMLLITCLLILSPGIAALVTYPTLLLHFKLEIPLLGINFTAWRLLIVLLAIPSGLGGIAISFFHESPKFLANCGKNDEALQVLKSMHAINNRGSKEEFGITSLYLEDAEVKKPTSLTRALYELGAPLFRPPMLWRTLQLYFIISIMYFTNNSLLVWLPYIMNLVRVALSQSTSSAGDICSLINAREANSTATPEICLGYIENNVIITLVTAQCIYSFLNFVISYLMRWRRIVLVSILFIATISGVLLGLMPELISSVFLLMAFSCTNLGMGILASYIVDLYPTSCRSMVACLSIMVARTSTFIGINVVGNLIFNHCHMTFYVWSIVVFTSVVAAWFLPPDKPVSR